MKVTFNLNRQQKIFVSILFTIIVSLYLVLPTHVSLSPTFLGKTVNISLSVPRLNFKIGSFDLSQEIPLKQGLDIKGGVQVVIQADMSSIEEGDRKTALDSLQEVISRRIDMYGVSESSIKTSFANNDYRLILELPGVTDPNQAIALIGQTAQMQFALPIFSTPESATESASLLGFNPTDLTGADLKIAAVTFETQDHSPAVSLTFKDEGSQKFAQLTKDNLGKPIAILLDGYPVTMPTVQTEITNGSAQITGNFTVEEAKSLAVQLNAGALPVPVSILSQKNIPATLGAESIQKSLQAGIIGLAMVIVFMIGNYGVMGIFASISLVIYGIYTLAIYKLMSVVISLPGIAGFLLSVGMAVDSNILIFERYKEEIRAGRPWKIALELGFGRAWDSIKDANTATIITGLILFNPLNWSFLNTSGSVRGFALTLIIGIFISLFTGIVVTRNLLRLFFKGRDQSINTKK